MSSKAQNESVSIEYNLKYEMLLAPTLTATRDGGTALGGGELEAANIGHGFVIKRDAFGFIEWGIRISNATGVLNVAHLLETSDSSLFAWIKERDHKNISNSIFRLLKIDKNGNVVFQQGFTMDPHYHDSDAIITDDDEMFVLSRGPLAGEVTVIKMDISGSIVWSKRLNIFQSSILGPHIAELNSDTLVLTARTDTWPDTRLIYIDQNSGQVLHTIRPQVVASRLEDLIADDHDNIYISGWHQFSLMNDHLRFAVTKIDSKDSVHWVRTYNAPGSQEYVPT